MANLGMEIVAASVENLSSAPCDTLRSDLFLCRHVHPRLLNKIASLDAMDFFYAGLVFPGFALRERVPKRQAYLRVNGLTDRESKAIRLPLRKLEVFYRRYLRERQPKVLAVSLNSERLITALYFMRMAKSIVPDIRIVLGGSAVQGKVGFSVFSVFTDVDYLVYGRGEFVAGDLVESIHRGCEAGSLEGPLLSRSSTGVVRHRAPARRSPFPLPDMKDYYEGLVRLTEQYGRDAFENMYGIAVIQSIGCWWNRCDFCSEPACHPGYVLQNCARVAQYISRMAGRYHISDVFLLDSIQPPPAYLRRLCHYLRRHPTAYHISSEIHARLDEAMLYRLQEAGFQFLQIGIESYSQNLLDRMNKGTNLLDLLHLLVRCADRGITVQGNILMHHPLETPEDVRETRRVMALTAHLFIPFLQRYFIAHRSPLEDELRRLGTRTYPLMRHSLLYPPSLRKRLIFTYRYVPENKQTRSQWRRIQRIRATSLTEKPVLMYVDGGKGAQVVDTRYGRRKSAYLDRMNRDLIVACRQPKTLADIRDIMSDAAPALVSAGLERLVRMGILFRQGDRYLTLAIPWRNTGRGYP